MTTIKSVLLAGFAAVAMTSAAQAADKNFDGAYVGAELGYNKFKFEDGLKDTGLYFGGVAGYRVQFDNDLVIGLEGRFGDTTADGDLTDAIEVKAGRQLGVDASIGLALGENKDFLAFALVGYSNAKVTGTIADVTESATGDGYRLGLGGEYALTENVSVRVTGVLADYEGRAGDVQVNAGVLFRF